MRNTVVNHIIPDIDFESEAYYRWEEEMADDVFRRSLEEREGAARDRKSFGRRER
jgi:hypothetical protein